MKKAMVIDSASLYVRAFFSSKDDEEALRSESGKLMNAVDFFLHFTKALRKKPDIMDYDVLFCFESPTPNSWRKTTYPKYKSNRPPMDPDLKYQLKFLRQVPELFGFQAKDKDGYESDDLIGHFVCSFYNNYDEIILVSSDKDLSGLLRSNVTMRDPLNKWEARNTEWVLKTFGIDYSQFYFYQALTGDSADGIPGVHRCGPKKAVEIVKTYDTAYNLLENWTKAEAQWPVLKGQKDAFIMAGELVNLKKTIHHKINPSPPMSVNDKGLEDFILTCRTC